MKRNTVKMNDPYVFELQLCDMGCIEHKIIQIDGTLMTDFRKLKKHLSTFTRKPFSVQYLDDEEDTISIDTEEEFKEFTRLVKHRSSRGMLVKLIMNTELPSRPNSTDNAEGIRTLYYEEGTGKNMDEQPDSTDDAEGIRTLYYEEGTGKNNDKQRVVNYFIKMAEIERLRSTQVSKEASPQESEIDELKSMIKAELKEEILSEMKSQMGAANTCAPTTQTSEEFEEDSDDNLAFGKRKMKSHHRCLKKIEKKEKLAEIKIDQRLEKLERKKKKLLESCRTTAMRKAILGTECEQPLIMSIVATKDSSNLSKKIPPGTTFIHVWNIMNDGTVGLCNVQLHHRWSTPGLEPYELSIMCPPLAPDQESKLEMKFKAPRSARPFISYWYFFFQNANSKWKQFGHYLSMFGSTKTPKLTLPTGIKVPEGNKKVKQYFIKSPKTVYFTSGQENSTSNVTKQEEEKVLNEEPSESSLKLRNASLASAQIAAEMAREAANAALRRSAGKQAAACSDSSKQSDKHVEEIVSGVQAVNLSESGSDTDANNDTNEADPGFVMVDMPGCFIIDMISPQHNGLHTRQELGGQFEISHHLVQPGTTASSLQAQGVSRRVLVRQPLEAEKEINESGNVKKDENVTANVPIEENKKGKENIETGECPGNLECDHCCFDEGYTQDTFIFNNERPVFPTVAITGGPPQQQPFFNADHPFNHQQRMPAAVYPPQHGIPHQQVQQGYQLFPSPSAHACIFPQPSVSMPHHFTAPKLHQIPTYTPIPAPSHAFPLITPTLPIQPPTRIPPPPLTTQPFPGSVVGSNVLPYQVLTPAVVSVASNGPQFASSTNDSWESTAPTQIYTQRNLDAEMKYDGQAQPTANDKKPEATIQILPQSLVDGAINVATSAYSTAWNALNNLRYKEGNSTNFDPVFENNMALLIEMGFNNVERNARLLKHFNNNLSEVISVICGSGGVDNLNID